MKVVTLIHELQKFDENADVWCFDYKSEQYIEPDAVFQDDDDEQVVLIGLLKGE